MPTPACNFDVFSFFLFLLFTELLFSEKKNDNKHIVISRSTQPPPGRS